MNRGGDNARLTGDEWDYSMKISLGMGAFISRSAKPQSLRACG